MQKLLILGIFLTACCLLTSHTILDSVYSVARLDGDICYTPDGVPHHMFTSSSYTAIGDFGHDWTGEPPPQ